MTPEDKSLTERAALAAGFRVDWEEVHQCFWISLGQGIEVRPWVPLEDDGQVFRLAVHLNIEIVFHRDEQTVWACVPDPEILTAGGTCTEGWGDDKAAAARRAIVTAAAAIWRTHEDCMDQLPDIGESED